MSPTPKSSSSSNSSCSAATASPAIKKNQNHKSKYEAMLKRVKADYSKFHILFVETKSKKPESMAEKFAFLGLDYGKKCHTEKKLFQNFQSEMLAEGGITQEQCKICLSKRSETKATFLEPDCGHLICAGCFGSLHKVGSFYTRLYEVKHN